LPLILYGNYKILDSAIFEKNNLMKKVFSLLMIVSFAAISAGAQSKFSEPDKSPLDISYFPQNYPLLKIQGKATEPLVARVLYGRPQKGGRVVFGELIEYGKVWRLGANEATEIEFYQNVRVGNAKLKKGRYTLYAIPAADKWTMILNKETDTWGAFVYDIKKDVARLDVPVTKTPAPVEYLSMQFEKLAAGFSLNIAWDNAQVSLPIYLQ
jgi:hypothetical protein